MRNAFIFGAVTVLLAIFGIIYLDIWNRIIFTNKKVHFEGEEHWEQWEREMCDDQDKDVTWMYGDSVCLTYVQHFEEVRMEILSWTPPLVIYRNFFTQKQVKSYLKLLEEESSEEQKVMNSDGKEYLSEFRKANGTSTPIHSFFEAQSLVDTATKLIPAMDFSIAESILALSYNPGGHYAVHYDYLEYDKEEDWDNYMEEFGNRLATFIMVFKKSGLGGGTLFPMLGTVVRVDPGDAYLWFNSKGNLEMEELSEHGGCPVHNGQKVIATIWLRSRSQPILERHQEIGSFHVELLIPKV